MRLLNVDSFELHEFFDDDIPPYSILSHRWGNDEVSYQDFSAGRKRHSEGYRKIEELCNFVKRRKLKYRPSSRLRQPSRYHVNPNEEVERPLEKLQWVWVDTCCIDKTSSAELSEAINSMYSWYSCSAECYVLMQDVPALLDWQQDQMWGQFERSAWFTRGWTLQEMLAPRLCVFCTGDWEVLGHITRDLKDEWDPYLQPRQRGGDFTVNGSRDWKLINFEKCYGADLAGLVSRASGVQVGYLTGQLSVRSASIARRMSWAANRDTSRVEDMAYSLLGLFDVNMPLLYGEGSKAFLRLQKEIIGISNDQSIFAWTNLLTGHSKTDGTNTEPGLLAPSIRHFQSSGYIYRSRARPERPYAVTNLGLHLQLRAHLLAIKPQAESRCVPHAVSLAGITFHRFAPSSPPEPESGVILVLLQCLHDDGNVWYRSRITDLLLHHRIRYNDISASSTSDKAQPELVEIFAPLQVTFDKCDDCNLLDYNLHNEILGLSYSDSDSALGSGFN